MLDLKFVTYCDCVYMYSVHCVFCNYTIACQKWYPWLQIQMMSNVYHMHQRKKYRGEWGRGVGGGEGCQIRFKSDAWNEWENCSATTKISSHHEAKGTCNESLLHGQLFSCKYTTLHHAGTRQVAWTLLCMNLPGCGGGHEALQQHLRQGIVWDNQSLGVPHRSSRIRALHSLYCAAERDEVVSNREL